MIGFNESLTVTIVVGCVIDWDVIWSVVLLLQSIVGLSVIDPAEDIVSFVSVWGTMKVGKVIGEAVVVGLGHWIVVGTGQLVIPATTG